ncbi:MAG: type II toxin-antitoxin system VapC family toxin [Acidobacteriaceae bacterium]|jgi:predicted nucleic acid-binding protein
MSFVVDASVAAVWGLSDENHPSADAARQRLESDPAIVPAIWWFELRNTFLVNERRGRVSPAETAGFLRVISRLPIHQDRNPEEQRLLSLARTHRLTIYDAAYLELAQREGIPLATLDAALTDAAKAEGVPLLGATP